MDIEVAFFFKLLTASRTGVSLGVMKVLVFKVTNHLTLSSLLIVAKRAYSSLRAFL